MPYNVLSSSGLIALVTVAVPALAVYCQLAAAKVQVWFREGAGQDLFAVGNLELATLFLREDWLAVWM